MYTFLIAVGALLLLSLVWMVYRIQTLVSVVKGSDKKNRFWKQQGECNLISSILSWIWCFDVLVFH